MQNALDQRIIQERGIEKTGNEWVIGLTLAMESEIDEIRREVNWRWWKNLKPIDTDALKGEVIDMWHFLVSLSDKVGLTGMTSMQSISKRTRRIMRGRTEQARRKVTQFD